MRQWKIVTGCTLALGISAVSLAQSPAEPPAPEPSRVIRGAEVTDRPFNDPGNESAKAVARAEGISIGEATSRLRRQWALNQFIRRLEQRNPELFSFVSRRGGELTVGLTDPSVDLTSFLPPGLEQIRKTSAKYSREGMYRKLNAVANELRRAGLPKVTVGLDPESGQVEFVTKDHADAVESAIANGQITVPDGYKITRDEIVVAAALYGGRSYNVDITICPGWCGGTTGFSLISTSGPTRYVSTAGHIDDRRARYNTSTTSSYASGGTSLTSVQDLRASLQLDIQYATPSDLTNNPPNPYFWDGSQYLRVTNWTYPTEGATFCKYGRETGQDCGVHARPGAYFNPDWNVSYLEVINKPAGQSCASFMHEGDSGGPVYYGTWAVGWVHGYYKDSCNMLYTPFSVLRSVQSAVDLIVYY